MHPGLVGWFTLNSSFLFCFLQKDKMGSAPSTPEPSELIQSFDNSSKV